MSSDKPSPTALPATGKGLFRYRCGHYRHESQPAGKCAICAEIEQLRADLNEVLDALEDVSPYVFAFEHQKRAYATTQRAAAVLAKHRPVTEAKP